MSKIEAILEIPEDTYLTLSCSGYDKERISEEAKRLLSAHLFKNSVLSLGKASELAGLSLSAFIDFLNELGLTVIDYDEDELQAEFATAREIQK